MNRNLLTSVLRNYKRTAYIHYLNKDKELLNEKMLKLEEFIKENHLLTNKEALEILAYIQVLYSQL